MESAIGVLAIAIGAGASIVGIASLLLGLRRSDDRLLATGRRCVLAVLLAAILAVGVMEWALITHDFSIRYVAENNARSTPLLFTVTGLWAALEGSILLWVLILAVYIALTVRHFRDRASEPLVVWATIVMLGVSLFFFLLVLGPANPFELTPGGAPVDGRGPNHGPRTPKGCRTRRPARLRRSVRERSRPGRWGSSEPRAPAVGPPWEPQAHPNGNERGRKRGLMEGRQPFSWRTPGFPPSVSVRTVRVPTTTPPRER